VHYCGVVPVRGLLQLAMLEEVRRPEPPIRLAAVFFEPGSAAQLASELRALGDAVVAIGAPTSTPREGASARACDELLLARGVPPVPVHDGARGLAGALDDLGFFQPTGEETEGSVPEGAFREGPVFETNPDAVFCALQGRRLPAKRHPHGMRLRIEELFEDHVIDDGGELWGRRIEEIDAAGAALCAHRFAVGHASWLGDPAEGVTVLPGSSVPGEFSTEGVLAPVERLQLPPVD
jgi:predicted nuclease with RNAse H fold